MKKILLIALSLLFCCNISYTCWYGDEDYYYAFFQSEELSNNSWAALVDYAPYLWFGAEKEPKEDLNIKAWKDYIGKGITEDAITPVVYKMDIATIEASINKKAKLPKEYANNAMVLLWQQNKAKQNIPQYLIYAKKCEKFAASNSEYWEDSPERDLKQMKKVLEEGILLERKEADPFLKNRYAYQIVRLAHYMFDYNGAIRLFDQLLAKAPQDYAYYRALEHKAGAISAKGQGPEAGYLFAKVFVACSDRQEVCVASFSMTAQDAWEKGIALCRTEEEKIAFYAMRALQKNANIIDEMESIYALNPQAPMLELLLLRYINVLQKETFSSWKLKSFPDLEEVNEAYLKRVNRLADRVLQNKDTKNHEFWVICSAYLELLNKNMEQCRSLLTRIEGNSPLAKRAKVLDFVAQLCALESIDAQKEAYFSELLLKDPYLSQEEQCNAFLRDVFAILYQKQGDKAKAFLCHNGLDALSRNLNLELIEAIEDFVQKTSNPNKFEMMLIGGDRTHNLSYLADMKGTYYLLRNNLDKAISAYEACSQKYQAEDELFNSTYLNHTIFMESVIHPYYFGDIEGQISEKGRLYTQYPILNQKFNRLSLAKLLKKLGQMAAEDPAKAAEYNYLIGLAWYNLSPIGWNRPGLYFSTDNGGHSAWQNFGKEPSKIDNIKNYAWINYFYYDANIAMGYFDKAISLSSSKELKAKACYMGAKTAKNLNYPFDDWGDFQLLAIPEYTNYFKKLSTEYKDSKYYQEVLRECYDFRHYLSQK